MSWDYYRTSGYNQIQKYQEINSGSSNIVVWTPSTSMRIALTALTVSSNLGGTIKFAFGGNQQKNLATFSLAGSSTIYPQIGGWESTAVDAPLYCAVSSGATNVSWTVTAEGFELE